MTATPVAEAVDIRSGGGTERGDPNLAQKDRLDDPSVSHSGKYKHSLCATMQNSKKWFLTGHVLVEGTLDIHGVTVYSSGRK